MLPVQSMRIWLYAQPTDMRKQFDGLLALAKQQMAGDIYASQLFVFINRSRTQMKALYYDSGGLCLWSKRLERGRFQSVQSTQSSGDSIGLNWAELQCLIAGIDWQEAKKMQRFTRPNEV